MPKEYYQQPGRQYTEQQQEILACQEIDRQLAEAEAEYRSSRFCKTLANVVGWPIVGLSVLGGANLFQHLAEGNREPQELAIGGAIVLGGLVVGHGIKALATWAEKESWENMIQKKSEILARYR